jgi:CheY-like chemotaxis protein
MKILLIDDKANKGWRQILEMLFPVQGIQVYSAVNIDQAKQNLEDKYDIIFLDVRLERNDHNHRDVKNYSGYKVLEYIKSDFLNVNFSTPIMLFTASDKIWSIQEFLNYGVDAFYVKEHPDNVFDKQISRENFEVLKKDFERLVRLSPKRASIWEKSRDIIMAVENHQYFNSEKCYINVRERIVDKIKLGYYYLFKKPNSLEEEILKVDNESFAFLIYFSVLEELVKGYTDKNAWDMKGDFSGIWKFRNDQYFISNDGKMLLVEPFWDKASRRNIEKSLDINDKAYSEGSIIYLSKQVYALIYHYKLNTNYEQKFRDLNKFRNKLSYTHSSAIDIYKKPLVDQKVKEDIFNNNLFMLELIENILKHK